jgi:hypothetical protein
VQRSAVIELSHTLHVAEKLLLKLRFVSYNPILVDGAGHVDGNRY